MEDIIVTDDPNAFVEQFQMSVPLSKNAGFDGVELIIRITV